MAFFFFGNGDGNYHQLLSITSFGWGYWGEQICAQVTIVYQNTICTKHAKMNCNEEHDQHFFIKISTKSLFFRNVTKAIVSADSYF